MNEEGEEKYVKTKYNILMAYFLIMMLILFVPLLFFTILTPTSHLFMLWPLTIILIVLVLLWYSRQKKKEIHEVKTVSREVRDQKEVKWNSKFLMGALILVLAILILLAAVSPLESLPWYILTAGMFILLIMGFRKYN
jgi:amino acid transporter